MKIDQDPSKEIDYGDDFVPKFVRDELEDYRLVKLAKKVISDVIDKMETSKKEYNELLSKEELELLNKLIKLSKSKKENLELLDKLEKTNRRIILDSYNINVKDYVEEYVAFINKKGYEPSVASESVEELVLANKYIKLMEVITSEEKKDFNTLIKSALTNSAKKDFYTLFVEFVETNKRLPSPIGETPEEIALAKDFQKFGTKLTREQKVNVERLKRMYQMNSIKYARSKGK